MAFFIMMIAAVAATAFSQTPNRKHVDVAKKLKKSDAEAVHEVIFGVKQKNLDGLHDALMDVSNPLSPNYGHHWTHDEVGLFISAPDSTEAVERFLNENGFNVVEKSTHGEYIRASGSIGRWESSFSASFHEYQHDGQEGTFHRSLSFNVPDFLADHIHASFNTMELTKGLVRHSAIPMVVTKASALTHPRNYAYNISEIIAAYGVDPNGNNLVSQGIFQSVGQVTSLNDLAQFQSMYGVPREKPTNNRGGHVEYPCPSLNQCAEANLDVQTMMGISQHTPTSVLYQTPSPPDAFAAFVFSMASLQNPPDVIAFSYGNIEEYIPPAYYTAFNVEAMKLGLRGVTLLVASGDSGAAAGGATSQCGYHPDYPATSPYVVAVGATTFKTPGGPEIATDGFRSGGGFSNYDGTPSWQQEAVNSYLKRANGSINAPVPGFNTQGRGYPDIAVNGQWLEIVIAGQVYGFGGTSLSVQVFAAMVSLVNAARKEAGKSVLGFINPALYALAKTSNFVNDITEGNNKGSFPGYGTQCAQGFHAAKGWDPVTGLGSINFPAFKAAFLALDNTAANTPIASSVDSPSLSSIPKLFKARTNEKKYANLLQYSGMQCEATSLVKVQSYPTGVCHQAHSTVTWEAVSSFRYDCGVGRDGAHVITMTLFVDDRCKEESNVVTMFDGCDSSQKVYYYADPVGTATEYKCSDVKPNTHGAFSTLSEYNSFSGCEGDTTLYTLSYKNGLCIRESASTSITFDGLAYTYFNSSTTCKGTSVSAALPAGCVQTPHAPSAFYHYYYTETELSYKWSAQK